MNAYTGRKFDLLVLGLALLLSSSASAQQQPPAREKTPAADVIGQKKVAFEMRGKPWTDVMTWLSKESGLPFYNSGGPAGTFTYIGPNGSEMKTISEVIDILNQALRPQKYIILRHSQSITIVPADEQVPPADVSRLTSPDELNNHGNSELVSLVYHLKALNAEEFAPQVKKMMTTFGTVTTIPQTNTLLMQDDVATLKQIVAVITERENLDTCAGGQPQLQMGIATRCRVRTFCFLWRVR